MTELLPKLFINVAGGVCPLSIRPFSGMAGTPETLTGIEIWTPQLTAALNMGGSSDPTPA
jgi:hypothetical protein